MMYESYVSWHSVLAKFPKSERHTLGQTVSQYILKTLECLIASAGSGDSARKKTLLQEASAKLDLLKLLIRLTKDCKCISNNQYLALESNLLSVGKMLGGWLKSVG